MIEGLMTSLFVAAYGVAAFALGYLVRRAKYQSLYGFNTGLMEVYEQTYSQLQDRTMQRDQLAAQLLELAEIESKRAEADRADTEAGERGA